MSSDAEKGQVGIRYITGFASLADAIASDQEHSTAIYKRFDRLAARNLLYMQSELCELESLQESYDQEDKRNADRVPGLRKAAMSWKAFEQGARLPQNDNGYLERRMKLAMEIRGKLRDYREALLFESALLSLKKPSTQTHTAFHQRFWNAEGGEKTFPTLRDASETLYEEKHELVSLNRVEEDRFTIFLRNKLPFLFRDRRRGQDSPWIYFSAKRISLVVSIVNILVAATFLFGAIYTLYNVERDQVKLGLIAGFTASFAAAISLLTNARRSEIFNACAAYAAVLVVFVSGELGKSNRSSTG